MTGDCHVRFGERLVGKFRRPTHLDLVYLPIENRSFTLTHIDEKLRLLKESIQKHFPALKITLNPTQAGQARQLICRYFDIQVKIEVNIVIRGTLYPVTFLSLSSFVVEKFKKDAQMHVVSLADLYGSKICAALDRQHPRDLFDMMLFFNNQKITRDIFDVFLFYLLSHPRPISEVINPTLLDIKDIYEKDFVGMTNYQIALEDLLNTRNKLIKAVKNMFTNKDVDFLLSFKKGIPNWSLFSMPNLKEYPSIQWKLKNIQAMNPKKLLASLNALEKLFFQGKQDRIIG